MKGERRKEKEERRKKKERKEEEKGGKKEAKVVFSYAPLNQWRSWWRNWCPCKDWGLLPHPASYLSSIVYPKSALAVQTFA